MKALSFKAYSWSIAFYWGLVLNSIFFSTADDVLRDESENRKATSRANNQTDIDLTNASATTQNLAHPKLLTNPHDSDVRDACQPRTLSPALWSKLNLNTYLLQYPGGQETSLEVPIT
ncbi:hypothetical protein PGTUg99_002233 [Puccinia graminis f. sp. tritici]|uniref:Uncharacterized protein n=1 Tax=Puccinia graminis f. sp. tritici TaxID=56615 RepID=A0A5B0S332_PUCGR|nr:hypothetical protein PGTUg99_002233 [Puccinia graminis f. sp. tritici]